MLAKSPVSCLKRSLQTMWQFELIRVNYTHLSNDHWLCVYVYALALVCVFVMWFCFYSQMATNSFFQSAEEICPMDLAEAWQSCFCRQEARSAVHSNVVKRSFLWWTSEAACQSRHPKIPPMVALAVLVVTHLVCKYCQWSRMLMMTVGFCCCCCLCCYWSANVVGVSGDSVRISDHWSQL